MFKRIKLTKPYRDSPIGWEGEMAESKCEALIARDNAVYIKEEIKEEIKESTMPEIKRAENKMLDTSKGRKIIKRKRRIKVGVIKTK